MKNQNKEIALFLICVIIIIIFSLFFGFREQKVVTLKTAVRIADKEAIEWSTDAKLAQVTSTDAQDDHNNSNGVNGKRKSWNLIYTSENKNEQYNIFVINGKVQYKKEILAPVYRPIDINEELSFDSNSASLIAKEEGLDPTEESIGFAVGYHFALQFMTRNDRNEPVLGMLVYGTSNDGKFSYVVINPRTKKVISVMEQQGYDESGRAIWTEKVKNK